MDAFIRMLLPEIRIRFPGYRIRRWLRRIYYAVTDTLVMIGAVALIVGVWYLCWIA